ncbi:MAG: dITP/XTP pyrophosphatase [Candidatus Dependentiae bacterium ADurb.Bin331]|nr:MAG: dITP/XTP pyrophosphatase [Candidatus Dependentiae bacterium ADurb.Bin331]
MYKEKKIVIATHNPGKAEELALRLAPFISTVSLTDLGITHDVEETGTTFEENVLLKANYYTEASKMLTIADDGGLCIDALNGAPGVYSSRFAGKGARDEDKIAKVLEVMKHVPADKRTASFEVILALGIPGEQPKLYYGTLPGVITFEPAGSLVPGLPYKTIFYVPEFGKTLAELEDHRITYFGHRDQAIAKLVADLIHI